MKFHLLVLVFLLSFGRMAAQCDNLDFSHLEPVYDLACISTPLVLTAVPDGDLPPVIIWYAGDVIISTLNVLTITSPGQFSLQMVDDTGCSESFDFTVSEEGLGNLPTQVFLQGCLEPGLDTSWCLSWWNPEYTYDWSDGGSGFCRSGLQMDQSYAITVTSPAGCVGETTVFVPFQLGLISSLEVLPGDGCGPREVEVFVYDDIGVGAYQLFFSRINPPGEDYFFVMEDQGVDTFLLEPGNYIFNVFSTSSVCVAEPYIFSIEGLTADWDYEVTACTDTIDLAIIPIGGTPPYTYSWSDATTTDSILQVTQSDWYAVTIVDADGCQYLDSILIEDWGSNGLFNSFESNAPDCGVSNGQLVANPLNGAAPFTYAWNTGDSTQLIESLGAGTYTVTITDANGCTGIFSQELTATLPGGLGFIRTYINEQSCLGDSAWLTVIDYNPDYTYYWSGPGFTELEADSIIIDTSAVYSLRAENALGCSLSTTGFMEVAGVLTGSFTVENTDCNAYTILEIDFTDEVDDDFIDHRFIGPDGTVIFATTARMFANQPGQYIYLGTHLLFDCTITDTIFLATVGDDCPMATGTLWADEGNCVLDGTEIPVNNWLVELTSADGSIVELVSTNADGQFSANLPAGDYTAIPLPYNSDLYSSCTSPQILTIMPDGTGYVDVFMPYLEECPAMYVNVVAPIIRRCFTNNAYLYFCNDGPVVAEDAQLVVELDPFLLYLGASVPPASVDGTTLTFDLGDLQPFECGTITLSLLASCDAELGQTHCIEATASPNEPCPTPDDWNGANLTLSGECDGDQLRFTITNDGLAPLSQPLEYIVIQDGVMLMGGPTEGPALLAGESFELPLYDADGSTYYVQTNQEPGNPDFGTPTIFFEGCGTDDSGNFTTGFVNQLPFGDADVDWYDVFCRDNTGSYDPNEKVGLPLGVDAPNYISSGTTITYDIQFQNTGTDTAFTVVIRDTIAPEFDLSTLRMGVSSHRYTFTVDSNRALVITFDDIMLPDSNVDLRGSQGVVSYTIDHHLDLPLGTELFNQAAIYFDFNEPIYTATTLHTLGEDFLSSLVPVGQSSQFPLTVFPNPADRHGTINFSLPYGGTYHLEIYDGLGRLVTEGTQVRGTAQFNLANQPRGWYVARALDANGNFLSITRFILE